MKQPKLLWLLNLLIVLNLGLIWGNSLLDGTDSGAVSGGVVAFLGTYFPFLATEAGHTLLRKAAHFSEFCLLGIFTGVRRMETGKNLTPGFAGWGMAVACIDETIQTFVPGRNGNLIDVWIDSAGYATGLLLAAVGRTIIRNQQPHTS